MYDRFKDPLYVYTRDSAANFTRELWEEREALKKELEEVKTRLALCEKVILDSVLSKTPPTP